jgi:hypothetical protein
LGRPFHDSQLRDLILAQSDAVGRSTPTILSENQHGGASNLLGTGLLDPPTLKISTAENEGNTTFKKSRSTVIKSSDTKPVQR